MKILILNVGSSSIKYKVYDNEKKILKGYLERVKDFKNSFADIVSELKRKKIKIDAIGHRVVHGGDMKDSAIITPTVLKRIESVSELAPLHNIPEVKVIKECLKAFNVPNVAVFDTSFFANMPEEAKAYAIPYELYKKGIKRYGFHGTSHHYVFNQVRRMLGKKAKRVIICHLGNGCSISAIKNGKPIETSMGMTPMEGLVMGTRSGDVDPGIIFHLAKKGMNTAKLEHLLNNESGLKGLSGISNDFRDIVTKYKINKRAKLAVDVFARRIVKYVGAYSALLGGLDALVFTAGIGENSAFLRRKVVGQLKSLGKFNALAIHTKEEKMILQEVKRLV